MMSVDMACDIISHKGWGYYEKDIEEASLMAIDAMQNKTEAQLYREKAKPRVEWYIRGNDREYVCYCPVCGNFIRTGLDKFCPECGKAIDWSDFE